VSRVEGDPPAHEGRTQIGKAIVLIVVVVLVAVLVLHHIGSSGAVTTKIGANPSTSTTTTVAQKGHKPKKTKKKVKPLIAPSKIKVQVLNGLLSGSLAGNLSAKLKDKPGYETLPANNTTVGDTTSMIYVVTPGYYREAKVLAAAVGLSDKSIHRGVPKTAPVPAGITSQANLVLVIGTSLKAKATG
jgi:hypothetical protein